MKKLTQKEKLIKAFLFAQSIKNNAERLKYVCNDDNYYTGKRIAEELITKANEAIEILR